MKNSRLQQFCFSIISFWILFIFSPTLFATIHTHTTTKKNQESYLFVQGATKATLTKSSDKLKNDYLLSLENVHSYITLFSERPTRKIKIITLEQFLKNWDNQNSNSFKQNPPNAAFHAIKQNATKNDHAQNYIFELSNPKYTAANKMLTYTAKLLGENTELPKENSSSFQDAILFIDDGACLYCW